MYNNLRGDCALFDANDRGNGRKAGLVRAGEIDRIAFPPASFGSNAGSAKSLLSEMYQKRKVVSVLRQNV
jgi:hypothetical protein